MKLKKTHLREKQLKYHPDNNIGKEDTVIGLLEETTVKLQNLREEHDQFLDAGKMVCLVDTTTTSSVTKFEMHGELMSNTMNKL